MDESTEYQVWGNTDRGQHMGAYGYHPSIEAAMTAVGECTRSGGFAEIQDAETGERILYFDGTTWRNPNGAVVQP